VEKNLLFFRKRQGHNIHRLGWQRSYGKQSGWRRVPLWAVRRVCLLYFHQLRWGTFNYGRSNSRFVLMHLRVALPGDPLTTQLLASATTTTVPQTSTTHEHSYYPSCLAGPL